jgi:glycosyltransferase involved in cell wall biosynthesis
MKMTAQKKASSGKIKVCYLLSYKQPEYTRTASMVDALKKLPDVELTVIRNRSGGLLRYWQTLSGLVSYRRRHKPDVFIVGFRAQESFWLFYPFMRGSRIVFDEFINHHDWIVDEHNKFGALGKWMVAILDAYMRWVVRRCSYVLTDTEAHARLSRELYRLPADKVHAIPVGADESLFKPMPSRPESGNGLEVFFYGNMLPLHGLGVILEAVKLLNENGRGKTMHFTVSGGRGKPKMINMVQNFIRDNHLENNITYYSWIDTEKLPSHIAKADVCLGGPFGGTGQAKRVVTGKTYQFLAMGKPVVIGETEVTGHFKDKANCVIAAQQDPAALAESLLWCAEHRSKLKPIGEQGLKLYEQEFSTESIGKTLHGLLIGAMGQGK